ncbi:hypothetical protein HAX54_020124, partial [Datura stramonium]|nr:hypothetical protein [Datura stramonium]
WHEARFEQAQEKARGCMRDIYEPYMWFCGTQGQRTSQPVPQLECKVLSITKCGILGRKPSGDGAPVPHMRNAGPDMQVTDP